MVDSALVERAKLGDKSAFDQLVLMHQARLLRVINQLIHDPSEALDVLQDTFVRAYRAINDYRGDSKFYTWIYRIAVNTAKTYLRSLEKRPQSHDALDESNAGFSTLSEQSGHTGEHYLLQAFERLPKPLQASMTLREIGGLSYLEIAAAMNVPIGTVRSRIFRARALLKLDPE